MDKPSPCRSFLPSAVLFVVSPALTPRRQNLRNPSQSTRKYGKTDKVKVEIESLGGASCRKGFRIGKSERRRAKLREGGSGGGNQVNLIVESHCVPDCRSLLAAGVRTKAWRNGRPPEPRRNARGSY